MNTIKLNNEQFNEAHKQQLKNLVAKLDIIGANPIFKFSKDNTSFMIEHNDNEGGRMKMMLFVKEGKLLATEI